METINSRSKLIVNIFYFHPRKKARKRLVFEINEIFPIHYVLNEPKTHFWFLLEFSTNETV